MTIRSLLFVPGDRPERVLKAATSAADAVAVDLEDAVALSRKAEARQLTSQAIRELPVGGARVYVRVNSSTSGLLPADVGSLLPAVSRLEGIIVPMCDSAEMVRHADQCLTILETAAGSERGALAIMPLLETAEGILNARSILSASTRVRVATFGPADLSRQLRVAPSAKGAELATARSLVVLASAAAGIDSPIDGPYLDLDDDAGLEISTMRAKQLGFGGKQAIHPKQLGVITAAFAPTAADLEWAAKVDEAFAEAEARGVTSIRLDDGTFIDYPVALRARDILASETSVDTL